MGNEQDLGASANAETGSREPDPSCTGSGHTGFDPARIAALIPPPEELRVLDCMSDEIIYPAKRLAEWARLSEARVREILRAFKSRGWAWYGVAYNEDEYAVSGSGYSLSAAGLDAREAITDYTAATIAAQPSSDTGND